MRRRMPGSYRVLWRGSRVGSLTPVALLALLVLLLIASWSEGQIRLVGLLLRGPQPLAVEQLAAERPALPAYVRLSGVARADLQVRREVSADASTSRPATRSVCRTPIVGGGWDGGAVPVVANLCDLPAGGAIEGMLFPLVPRNGELAAPEGIDAQGRIDLAALPFRYDGTQVYYLDTRPAIVALLPTIAPLLLTAGAALIGLLLIAIGWLARRSPAFRADLPPGRPLGR